MTSGVIGRGIGARGGLVPQGAGEGDVEGGKEGWESYVYSVCKGVIMILFMVRVR